MFVGGLGTGIAQLLAGIYSDRPRMIKMEQPWITDRMKGNVYRKMFTIQGLLYLSSSQLQDGNGGLHFSAMHQANDPVK